jgi:hypothetical protein
LSELRNLDRAVKAEFEDLGSEIADVQPLVNKLSASDPDSIEIRAIAGTLHAFYNGVERVFHGFLSDGHGRPNGWRLQLAEPRR